VQEGRAAPLYEVRWCHTGLACSTIQHTAFMWQHLLITQLVMSPCSLTLSPLPLLPAAAAAVACQNSLQGLSRLETVIKSMRHKIKVREVAKAGACRAGRKHASNTNQHDTPYPGLPHL
jgi:hypothetical protein